MTFPRPSRPFALFAAFAVVSLALAYAAEPGAAPNREQSIKRMQEGNWKDALAGFRKLALDPKTDPIEVQNDFNNAIACYQNLGDVDLIDEFREAAVVVHKGNWRLIRTAAQSYLNVDHHGYMVAGKFDRGHKRGGGQIVHAAARDRVRGLQLMVQAIPLADKDPKKAEVADFYIGLSDLLLSNRGYQEAWRLQYLTELGELPDYEDGWYNGGGASNAPVDAEGNPVYHTASKDWASATTDGQRWRWCLAQAVEVSPGILNNVRWRLAGFMQGQFGVQTLAEWGYWFGRMEHDDGGKDESGTYALHTLGEDETIARLATGIKRFKIPDEFNYIRIWQQIASDPGTGFEVEAIEALAQEFENRRQYPPAAAHWKKSIGKWGNGPNDYRRLRLEQIVKPWCRFEPTGVQPAGRGASFEFRHRNGKSVQFEAREIDVERLLAELKTYIKSNPQQLDWQRVNIQDLSWQFVNKSLDKYVKDQAPARWDLELDPRPNHFDRRITVTTPLQKAGVYLVHAKLAGGQPCHTLLWVDDTVVMKKNMPGQTWHMVVDAASGSPLAGVNVEFFGYRQVHVGGNRYRVDVRNFAEKTDEDGQIILPYKAESEQFSWVVSARTEKARRFAFLGFTNYTNATWYDAEYEATKVMTITDRPVYRPKQSVKYKFWIRHAKYDQPDRSDFAGMDFRVELRDPQGTVIDTKQFKADEYGGFDGSYDLPVDAKLGVYQLSVVGHSGGSFRVEEYKKPEYEVTVEAPKEPVMLGEKITAKVAAKYYFGSPVTKAKVKYKVLRSNYTQQWYAPMPWDWFYGPGYWWFGYDYSWYRGFHDWGCMRPIAWWWNFSAQPPEVVAEGEVPIGADGTISIDIDTSLAKEMHGNSDHSYSITAEVVDQSRRTIVGAGSVLVARKPFKVFSWLDHGYYRVGDTIRAEFSAQTLDQKPVQGKGRLKLLAISYDAKNAPVETAVEEWELDTTDQGRAAQQITADQPGQYRLSYTVTDAAGHEIEGGYVFTVMGQGFKSGSYRFSDIELVPDKREYAPGEKVKLQVNVNKLAGTVALFIRPANSVYQKPQIIRMKGKSAVATIDVAQKDMPNFFVEAITVADGKLHTETKELIVPPEKRVLSINVEPSQKEYLPGAESEVKFTVTDFFGKPFVGSTVVAMYDKSVEYISGGTNVPDIKDFFWKWRRHHYPVTEHTLGRYFYSLVRESELAMNDLGIFGGGVAEELAEDGSAVLEEIRAMPGGFGGGGGGLGGAVRLSKGGRMSGRQGNALPQSAPADGLNFALGDDKAAEADFAGAVAPGAEGGAAMVQPTVRQNFADTAFWAGALTTDGDGVATVKLTMPENLTAWKIKAWGMGHGTKCGEGSAEVVTRKNLLVRLQAPRFFVERDEVVLSANVHNYLPRGKSVRVALELEGGTLAAAGETEKTIEIDAASEKRVDWLVRVTGEGPATVRMKALTDEESDAMQMSFPCFVHGMLKFESFSGMLRPADNAGAVKLRVPAERRVNDTRLEVRYSPTLAGAMVDALPYMVDYPYGCTEQTLNRFLPTVVTQRILIRMGLDLNAIRDKRANLNAQEIGDPMERARGWKRFDRNPVFDEAEVRAMVKDGVQKLTEMQLSDGGWGWFSGWGEHSWPHTTAVVVHGLQVAQENDVALVPGMLDRGVAWLKRYQAEQTQMLKNAPAKKQPWKSYADNLDAMVFMVLVDAGVVDPEMKDFIYRDRTHLAVYAKAMAALAMHKINDLEKRDMLRRNIEQFLHTDDENQTAWLKLPEDNYWWHWYGSEIEAQSYYLKLLSRVDAQGETAPRLVKYLLNNRKHASYWNSTRDSAVAIEALAEYLVASGEDKPDLSVEVWLDGKKQKDLKINRENLFTFDDRLLLVGDAIETGQHTLELKKQGAGPLYYNAYLTNFTLEDHIERAGLEIKVNRKLYRLKPVDKREKVVGARGQAVDQRVEKYVREEIVNLGEVTSGDLCEVELEIDSKNDYEYLIFEDMKAAGFEPVDVQSGYNGNALGAYVEFRDNRVAFFTRALARGKHSVSYRLRAEIPGKFSALPTRAAAMYAPELKANSDEIKVRVLDRSE